MRLFEELVLKFDQPDWQRNTEFGLIDSILERNPQIIELISRDIIACDSISSFGRGDSPSVEQIVRAAIFKEMRGLNYRELEYAQHDSRICELFLKIDTRKFYSFRTYQKYISRIKPSTLQQVLYEINRIAIFEGFEDVSRIVQDTTVVQSNIHYPTNSSLVWDCIHENYRILEHLKEAEEDFDFIDYRKGAKKNFFKINVTRKKDKRYDLFCNQLILFNKVIYQTAKLVKKKCVTLKGLALLTELEAFINTMEQVYSVAVRQEIYDEKVSNDEKIFSIYEPHTDIIVKGHREVLFGHKVSITTGKSNLILDCQIMKGNLSDSNIYQGRVQHVIDQYGIIPEDSAADGGYASKENLEWSKESGIMNVVFNKVRGSMQNQARSKNLETRLKKWRASVEANISNLKRKFDLRVCVWKGWKNFQSKVLWSAIAFNFRVMTKICVDKFAAEEQSRAA